MNKIMKPSYELAKTLKDAGFVQENGDGKFLWPSEAVLDSCGKCADEVYLPTLSELIEACGDDFKKLIKDSSPWRADGWNGKEIFEGHGSTPEEAVANLWLALNPGKCAGE